TNYCNLRLQEKPKVNIQPVMKAEFEGELSIIPEETVSADANNTWSITDENIGEGYNYADEGNYSNTKQTNIRQTAYIETNSEEPVYLDLSVEADEDK